MNRMNGQPIIPDILLKVPPDTRTPICLRLLLFYLAMSVSSNAYQNIKTDNWGITRPYTHKVKYTWTMDWLTVPSKMEANHILLSPYFSPSSAPEFKLQLIIYPKNTVFPGYVVIKFIYVSGPLSVIYNDVEFTVLDKTCKSILTVNVRNSGENENMYKLAKRKWFEDNADTVLTNSGQLRLVLSTEIQQTNCSCDVQCKTPAVAKPAVDTTSQTCHFSKYLQSNNFSDGSIVPKGGKKIPVHKVIMVAQSSVLAKAYLTNNTFQADDIEGPTMSEMICYLYCKNPHFMPRLANKLLAAADSLQIDGLKKMCEAELSGRINATNAKEIYDLANKYNAKNLKNTAAEYMKSNRTEMQTFNSSREISQ